MAFDPDEIVTLYGQGKMTLRTAVRKVLDLDPHDRTGATIFREGDPAILDLSEIEKLGGYGGN
jgi:hypothetical protein